MMRSAGPKPSSSVPQPVPCRMGTALISTPWSIRNDSSPSSTNTGNSVVNVSAVRGAGCSKRRDTGAVFSPPPWAGGHVTGCFRLPSMLVLRL